MLRQALACCEVGTELVWCVDGSTEKWEKKCYLYWRLFSFKINSHALKTQTLHPYIYCASSFFLFSWTVFLYPKIPSILEYFTFIFLRSILAHQLKLCLIQKSLGTSTTSTSNWEKGSKASGLFCVACRGCKWIYSLLCAVWLKFLLRLSKNSMPNYKSLVNCLIQLW